MKHTGICRNCRMKIPEGASICPYCHTKDPDLELSTMETIIMVVGIVLGGAILFLLILLLLGNDAKVLS